MNPQQEQPGAAKGPDGVLASAGRSLRKALFWQPFGGPIATPKQGRTRRLLFSIAYRLAFVPILLAAIWVALLGALMHPDRTVASVYPERFDLTYQNVQFTSADGVRLHGWYLCALKPADVLEGEKWKQLRPGVVLCHEYGANRSQLLSPLAERLLQAGYDVLVFDFRGHGYSGDAPVSFGHTEAADVLAAVDALRNTPGVDPERIGIYGTGMGGYAAMLAGPRSREVKCVVAESAYPSVNSHLRRKVSATHMPAALGSAEAWGLNVYFGRRLVDGTAVESVRSFGDRGLLVINGARDRIAPASEMAEVADAGGDTVMTMIVANAGGHEGLCEPNTLRAVLHFFDSHLRK